MFFSTNIISVSTREKKDFSWIENLIFLHSGNSGLHHYGGSACSINGKTENYIKHLPSLHYQNKPGLGESKLTGLSGKPLSLRANVDVIGI